MQATRKLLAASALIAALSAPAAFAAPCVGFTDVEDTSLFCPNVEWLKNRSITLGCGANQYCPTEAVSRLAMAAFMNRLGTALTPVQLRRDTAPGGVDLDVTQVVCQTGDFAVVGFPRRAFLDLALTATGPTDVDFAADLVMSTNAGAGWTLLTTTTNRGFVPASRWGSLANLAHVDLDVGQTVRFGVRLGRDGLPGSGDLADSRCQLRALIYSRDGGSSPR
jgi:hypothetical protein